MADADTPSTEKPFPEAEKPHKAKAASLNTALEESFSRVREDILQMKKVLNQHAEQLTEVNAKLQVQAIGLGGSVTYLDPEEGRKTELVTNVTVVRPWELWKKRALSKK